MIAPDDARHGTRGGSRAGCDCQPCRAANVRYQKRWDLDRARGVQRTVPIIGSMRRSQALERLGWSMRYQSGWMGRSPRWVENVLYLNTSGRFHTHNHDLFVTLYDAHSMRLAPASRHTTGVANRAQQRRYLPPLAWDDELIDDPSHDPTRRRSPSPKGTRRLRAYVSVRDDVDEAVVLRVLAGERRLTTTPAERAEIVRRWLASGRPERQLCQDTGWRMGRYIEPRAEVS